MSKKEGVIYIYIDSLSPGTFACGQRRRRRNELRCQGERAINIRRVAVNFNPRIACAVWYRRNDYEHFYNPPHVPRKFLDIPPSFIKYLLDTHRWIRRCSTRTINVNFDNRFINNLEKIFFTMEHHDINSNI